MPADSADELPCSVYMTLRTRWSAMKVVKLFTAEGWSWRNSAWDEYEVTASNVAELEIFSKNPVLISGGVASDPAAMATIERILENGGIDFDFDLFDENDKLVRSRPNPSSRQEDAGETDLTDEENKPDEKTSG